MSEIDKKLYADAEAIAAVIDKKIRWVHKLANKDNWEFITETTRSRHPKKWFLIAALPQDIHDKVVRQRSLAESAALYGQQSVTLDADLQASVDQFHAEQPETPVYTADHDWFRRRPSTAQNTTCREHLNCALNLILTAV